jgi:hypothetical protein
MKDRKYTWLRRAGWIRKYPGRNNNGESTPILPGVLPPDSQAGILQRLHDAEHSAIYAE